MPGFQPFQVFPNAAYNLAAFSYPRNSTEIYQYPPVSSYGLLSGSTVIPYFTLSGSGVFGGVSAIGILYSFGQFGVQNGATVSQLLTAGQAYFQYTVTVNPVTGANGTVPGDSGFTLTFAASSIIPVGATLAVELANRTFNTFQVLSGSNQTFNLQLSDFNNSYSSLESIRRIQQSND